MITPDEIAEITKKIQRVTTDNSTLLRLISQNIGMINMEEFNANHAIYRHTYEMKKDKLIETLQQHNNELIMQSLQEMYDVVHAQWEYLRSIADNMVQQDKIK